MLVVISPLEEVVIVKTIKIVVDGSEFDARLAKALTEHVIGTWHQELFDIAQEWSDEGKDGEALVKAFQARERLKPTVSSIRELEVDLLPLVNFESGNDILEVWQEYLKSFGFHPERILGNPAGEYSNLRWSLNRSTSKFRDGHLYLESYDPKDGWVFLPYQGGDKPEPYFVMMVPHEEGGYFYHEEWPNLS